MKRFSKYPESILAEFRRLLLTTEYSRQECIRLSGIRDGSLACQISKECRRHIGPGRWVNRQTGQVCPDICTTTCAAEKIGVTKRTINRRVAAGEIKERRAVSYKTLRIFDDVDIGKLQKIGRKKTGSSTLTESEVRQVKRLHADGWSSRQIATHLDHRVSDRQIRRIIQGTRWAESKH